LLIVVNKLAVLLRVTLGGAKIRRVLDGDQRIPVGDGDNARAQQGETGMEFHIRTRGASPNLDAINAALLDIDPMAVADIEPGGASLRVSAALSSPELIALLTQACYPVDWKQLEEVPSVCCGACGG
jgi:hypothetical protein